MPETAGRMAVALIAKQVVTRDGEAPRDVHQQTIRGTADAGGGTAAHPGRHRVPGWFTTRVEAR